MLGQIVVMALQIREQLFHGAAGVRAGAEEQILLSSPYCFGHCFIKTLQLRFALAI